ncbi:MAG: YitT family protein [Terrisporobacter othiniensis]|uniref:YitT family protein n=1 Tax=Terrisporobacter petrolearius TaxID=1460447 RepID=UPI0022E17575|nr:YitT family protein [Terrisporobacter petrolearius]MDU4860728.1 YitT family protein [Terrisporobacter othiniensis]MDU6996617.1 YitT family protein [Terrisporobacter othiniensis]
MSKVNTMEHDNIYVRYSIIIVGITIMSIGVNGFLRQAHLLSGGVAGVSTAINYLSNINVGFITFLINVPIFILGFIFLDKDFLITSLINMILFSVIIGITQDIGNIIPIDDILLQSVYGGILCGIGNGLVFRTKSSLGGTDILGAILKNKLNIAMKTTSFGTNLAIVSVSSLLFGANLALYTLISMFINAQVMNYIKDALNDEKAVMVFSNNSEPIANEIMDNLVRGVTFLDAEGGYTHEKKKIIYCVVLSREIPKIKEIALKYDDRAFISVNDINEVKGKGFKEKFL